jgi:hypothetical protein
VTASSPSSGEEGFENVNDVEGGFPIDFPIDEAPEGDAVEQRQPVESDKEPGLDTDYLNTADRDANEADVIEQAFIVPPDDDWENQR